MKKFSLAFASAALLMAPQALAAFTSAQLLTATGIAITDFEAVNPDHAAHFTGFKSWKSGEEARVRIYVDHGGHAMEFNYSCLDHDDELECHAN